MKQEKGFTLIELLAVIVILAVIALIATPIIIGIIEDAKEKANENSAYGIIDSANYYFTNGMLKEGSVQYNTNILNSLTYNGQQPKEGSVAYVNEQGQVAVALLYGNKCYKKEYTDSKISLGDVANCTVDVTPAPVVVTLADTLKGVTLVTSGSGLYKIGEEYRFRGGCNLTDSVGSYSCSDADPVNNYVSINGQQYRIISMDSQGVKVMMQDQVTSMPYDERTSTTAGPRNNAQNTFCQVTSGTYYGCNVYAVPIGGSFTAGSKTGTVTQNSTLYDYLNTSSTETAVTTLRNVAKSASWNIGAVTYGSNVTLATIQSQEAAFKANFKLGLINTSDYIQGSLDSSCAGDPINEGTSSKNCRNQNWIFNPSSNYPWTINPFTDPAGNSYYVWGVFTDIGYLNGIDPYRSTDVRPVAYIDANIQVTSGTGTSFDPWILNS